MSGDVYGIALEAIIRESRMKSKVLLALLIVLGFSLGLNLLQWRYLPEPKVVSETEDGRIRPLPTLDQPMFTPAQVMSWAAEKMESMYDLPFTEISAYPGKISEFMMPQTRDQFLAGLTQAGILEKVRAERRILRAVRSAPPTMLAEYLKDGRYIWEIEMPLTVMYEGAKDTQKDYVILKLAVGREHLMRAKGGLIVGRVHVRAGRAGS